MSSDEETTVSWKAIEPHWKVWSADGVEIGEVFLPVGDENTDIFDGLAITHHGGPSVVHNWLDRPRYVSQDKVAAIQEGHVRLTIRADEAHAPARAQRARDRRDPARERQPSGPHEDRPRKAHARGQDLLGPDPPWGRELTRCARGACAARPWAATRRNA